MSRAGFSGSWSLVFDGTAVLVFGDAGWEALQNRDFLPLTLFTLFGAMYCAGFLMQISDHRAARAVNVRLQAAGIYFFTAFTTAVSVDDSMYMASVGGHPFQGWWHTILVTSLVGSLVLAGAFVRIGETPLWVLSRSGRGMLRMALLYECGLEPAVAKFCLAYNHSSGWKIES